jgi:predicted nucleic acid-binding protein
VRAFFDSSVLVPLYLEAHEHHAASYRAVNRYKTGEAGCAAHTLAEVYSALTRLPGKLRTSTEQAMLHIDALRAEFKVISLSADDAYRCLNSNSRLGITGGSIYDALVAQAALKADAERIYTWNMRHFSRLGEDVTKRLYTP